ncbi:MAG: hypothetical protein J2P27_00350 [Actinobacteria bacterium]|nr:hypothetical protein [Actinomycetota bacterium]
MTGFRSRTLIRVIAVFAVTSVLAGCTSEESQRRFHVLQRDPFLDCHVAGVTPWINLDRIDNSYDSANQIWVERDLHLIGSASLAFAELTRCARKAGWSITVPSYNPQSFEGHKRFEGRWTAIIQVFVGPDVFKGQPAVEMIIETSKV